MNYSQWPLITVCVPAYNAEKTLSRTLESILGQDYPNYEVFVSDNHSSDATAEIIKSYASRGVKYCCPPRSPSWAISSESYIGAYININFLLSKGAGGYICVYHADDVYHSNILRKQISLINQQPNMGAVFTMLTRVNGDGEPIRHGSTQLPKRLRGRSVFDFRELIGAVLYHSNFLATPSVMLRRSAVTCSGEFNERKFRTSADLEMWLRIAEQFTIGVIDEPLLKYRVTQNQGGIRYHRTRTAEADFYTVIDHFLKQKRVASVVFGRDLAVYEMNRGIDNVFRAMNLLVQGNSKSARSLLRDGLEWRHFGTALTRPNRLARLLVGSGLYAASFIRCDGRAARLFAKIYLKFQLWLQQVS